MIKFYTRGTNVRKRSGKDKMKILTQRALLVRKTEGEHESSFTPGVLLVREESENVELRDSRNVDYGKEINFLKVKESFFPRAHGQEDMELIKYIPV